MLDVSGNSVTVTMPTAITIDGAKKPRFAVMNQLAIMVNSCSRPITIDQYGIARPLTPRPPRLVPSLSGTGSGTLSGTYLVAQTFIIKDADGNVIAESDYGPTSASATITTQQLLVSGLDKSPESSVTGSRLYRTATGGATFFLWAELDGRTQTTYQDDLSDASLALTAAPTLGSPRDFYLIAEWRERLWGVGRANIDHIMFSEPALPYSWPSSNERLVPRLGEDNRGITGLIPRKEALGIGRQNIFYTVTGNDANNFRVVKHAQALGIESQETVQIHRDVAYWLWKDGIYEWGPNGINCISDGKVRSWFSTDTYFNRDVFKNAYARIDPVLNRYQVFLAAAGGTTINRWVEYDINTGTWWGPHKTDDFTPTAAFTAQDGDDVWIPLIGSSGGFLYIEQDTRTDGTSTAISFSVATKFHDGETPDIEKYFGQMSIHSKIQAAGTLTITPKVGGLDASAGSAISHSMTLGRERLRRLGTGRYLQLTFTHATAGQKVELYGYEVPYHELGRR